VYLIDPNGGNTVDAFAVRCRSMGTAAPTTTIKAADRVVRWTCTDNNGVHCGGKPCFPTAGIASVSSVLMVAHDGAFPGEPVRDHGNCNPSILFEYKDYAGTLIGASQLMHLGSFLKYDSVQTGNVFAWTYDVESCSAAAHFVDFTYWNTTATSFHSDGLARCSTADETFIDVKSGERPNFSKGLVMEARPHVTVMWSWVLAFKNREFSFETVL
jgi:hypothetical protein